MRTAGSTIGIQAMDRGVVKSGTLTDSKDPDVRVTYREQPLGTFKKNRVIAKVSELSSKYSGWMNTRLHFKKGRAAAQTTPGETAILFGRNEVGNYAA